MLQVCVLIMAGLFAALVVRKDKPEYATLIILLTSFLVAMKVLGVMEGIMEEMESWREILNESVR